MQPLHMVDLQSFSKTQLNDIIQLSLQIKANPQNYRQALADKTLYLLFQKTSTRTAMGFSLAMNQLGGHYFFQTYKDSNFSVGEVEDEIRYVGRNVDIVLARLIEHSDVAKMARYATVPIINGCCNKHHPTQALADMLTVAELFNGFAINMLYIGAYNNVLSSLAASLPKLGGKLTAVVPADNEPIGTTELQQFVDNDNLELVSDPAIDASKLAQLATTADIVYTDSWIDMEFFNNPELKQANAEKINNMQVYKITRHLLQNSSAVVFHDMPIHPEIEIERDVVEQHIETILHQAENRRHVAKGILLYLLQQS